MTSTKKLTPIPMARPTLDASEERAVLDVIRSGWVLQGPRVADFEREFAAYVGATEAVAVSSGTAALHLTLLAAGIGQGDSVICPSYSFIATANSIRHCGAEAIFVDIDPHTYNLNPDLLEGALRPNTRAVMTVHQVGFPSDIERIAAFCERHGLIFLEDAACALGSRYRGELIGKPHSLAAAFSFHPRKVITTGDGGMVTTNSAELARRIRALRQHGIISPAEGYLEVGYNFRLTDMQAAMGREQLRKLPELLARRRAQAKLYIEAFSKITWLRPQLDLPHTESNYQSFQARILSGSPITQKDLIDHLARKGITAQPGILPIHKQHFYNRAQSLPETERAHREVVMLPIYHSLTPDEQQYIIDSVLELF